jgi:hypothetical protein
MKLGQVANEEVGRLLNGTNNSQHAAIGHLSSAAGRAAESLVYLADIDNRRFKEIWPDDEYQNDVVDDGHVRWAAAGALTSIDLCMAAAARLGGFAMRPPRGEDSIRDCYHVMHSGKVTDNRDRVRPPNHPSNHGATRRPLVTLWVQRRTTDSTGATDFTHHNHGARDR